MQLGTEVGLGPGHIVLDGDPAPLPKGHSSLPPHFSAHFTLALLPISASAEHLLSIFIFLLPVHYWQNVTATKLKKEDG